MQILITGGAGFIGSHTADAALAAGHSVRVLDDFSTGEASNLPERVDVVSGDVTDADAVEAALGGCDAVMHLAALVSVPQSLREPIQTHAVNTTGSVVVLEASRRLGVRRFVLASTSAVYGDLPGPKDESSALAPQAPYATSKLGAEQWAELYARIYGMETLIFRYFNVYGPRQRADSPYSGVLARWCAAIAEGAGCHIYGDGTQTRDFVSVHDVAAANLFALTGTGFAWGEVHDVATGRSVSLNAVLDAFGEAALRPLERVYEAPRAGDVIHSASCGGKLRSLGWRPTVSLRDGLAELLAKAAPRETR